MRPPEEPGDDQWAGVPADLENLDAILEDGNEWAETSEARYNWRIGGGCLEFIVPWDHVDTQSSHNESIC